MTWYRLRHMGLTIEPVEIDRSTPSWVYVPNFGRLPRAGRNYSYFPTEKEAATEAVRMGTADVEAYRFHLQRAEVMLKNAHAVLEFIQQRESQA